MNRFITTNSFNAVGAGQTATLDLPVTQLYRMLQINYTRAGVPATKAQMESDISQVRLKIDGKVQRVFSAEELFSINSFNGHVVANGRLPIFFSEPTRRSAQGEDVGSWGTSDIATFQVEVDIDGDAVSPGLSANVLVDPANRAMGAIVKWRRQNIPVTATGIVTTTTLDKNNAYYRIHAFSTDIDGVEVLVDQNRILEGSVGELTAHYAAYGLTVPAGETVLAFDADQRISSALAMAYPNKQKVSEFRIEWDMAAATSFNIISELLGMRD